ncbi:MAG: alpha/beta fold hydrolase [Alphaproteobacteria bacterium]|nr:alpha/beta fold hydrolase [Alphaproteobacteria bacterium]
MAVNTEALVLLPALLCDSRLFRHQIDALNGQLPVIVPDISTFDRFEDMAVSVIASLPPAFALVGNSMGGYLALEIVRRVPKRVTHLALVGTNAYADPPEAHQKRKQAIRLAEAGRFDQFIEGYVQAALYPAHVDRDGPLMATMAKDLGPDVLIRHQKAIMGRRDSTELLSAISVPVSVLCGSQDVLSSPSVHQDMAQAISGAEFREIENCGHLAPLEAPEVVTQALKDLLAR